LGYVLGARAGRERYEQIRSMATKFRNDPRVQQKTQQATDLAKEKAPIVKDKVQGVAGSAAAKVKDTTSSSDDSLEEKLHPDSTALQDDPYPRGDLP
jgi:flagellar hook-length control protein FliK